MTDINKILNCYCNCTKIEKCICHPIYEYVPKIDPIYEYVPKIDCTCNSKYDCICEPTKDCNSSDIICYLCTAIALLYICDTQITTKKYA
jgi:hypothetical protein